MLIPESSSIEKDAALSGGITTRPTVAMEKGPVGPIPTPTRMTTSSSLGDLLNVLDDCMIFIGSPILDHCPFKARIFWLNSGTALKRSASSP